MIFVQSKNKIWVPSESTHLFSCSPLLCPYHTLNSMKYGLIIIDWTFPDGLDRYDATSDSSGSGRSVMRWPSSGEFGSLAFAARALAKWCVLVAFMALQNEPSPNRTWNWTFAHSVGSINRTLTKRKLKDWRLAWSAVMACNETGSNGVPFDELNCWRSVEAHNTRWKLVSTSSLPHATTKYLAIDEPLHCVSMDYVIQNAIASIKLFGATAWLWDLNN